MDKKKETMTEKELELAADKLLEEADSTPEKPSSEPKTQDELLSELLEKAKKSGKISTKEIAALEEKGVDAETISKFYDSLEANGVDVDISGADAVPILDDIALPELEELNEIEEVTEEEIVEVEADIETYTTDVPQGDRQGAPADSGRGGRTCDKDERGRRGREAPHGRGKPASGSVHCKALCRTRNAVPRPHSGGQPRSYKSGREIRLYQGL